VNTLETPLRKKILKRLREEGGFWYHPAGNPMTMAGIPDLIGCYEGRFVGLEVKRPGKPLTQLQAHTLKQIKAAGGVAAVVHSVEEAMTVLRSVTRSPSGDNKEIESSS
jgi:hypothetical protein